MTAPLAERDTEPADPPVDCEGDRDAELPPEPAEKKGERL